MVNRLRRKELLCFNDYKNRLILKPFDGKSYSGKVISFDGYFYTVLYEDADYEEMDEEELLKYLVKE
jgi:small nuclear ribonucleoprotein (snRNP)-like protein